MYAIKSQTLRNFIATTKQLESELLSTAKRSTLYDSGSLLNYYNDAFFEKYVIVMGDSGSTIIEKLYSNIIDKVDAMHFTYCPEYTIAGYKFTGTYEDCFMCFRGNDTLWLGDAYKQGWLSGKDIKIIHEKSIEINEKHKEARPYLYKE